MVGGRGGGGKKVLWYFILICMSPCSSSHYNVCLIVVVIWNRSGTLVRTANSVYLDKLMPLRTWRTPVVDLYNQLHHCKQFNNTATSVKV